ncbi:hypothetical protein RHGRI_021949 [Rhododendron griersonianum]|uniref:Thaumatin-like protein n=1 Tax=Rhododendron griersonianum TaxID=479676 RepID=A0AAV6JQW2_9ERIC|nr:hypothetical protein RHGRI_021949 [Rhododendron griersonianum]
MKISISSDGDPDDKPAAVAPISPGGLEFNEGFGWEKHQTEKAALGRGKYQRKAVSYREAYAPQLGETLNEVMAVTFLMSNGFPNVVKSILIVCVKERSRVSARDTVFTLKNLCSYTIWPATLAGNNGAVLGGGCFSLAPGASNQLPAPPGWSGRFWARTVCSFDAWGNGKCTTGDCGGNLMCIGSGMPPITLAEFTIGSGTNAKDFYDPGLTKVAAPRGRVFT